MLVQMRPNDNKKYHENFAQFKQNETEKNDSFKSNWFNTCVAIHTNIDIEPHISRPADNLFYLILCLIMVPHF